MEISAEIIRTILNEVELIREDLAEIKGMIENLKKKRKPSEIHPEYEKFIKAYNDVFKRNARGDEKSKRSFGTRIKEGWSLGDFVSAMINAKKDEYHVENEWKYLTPEYFTRSDKLSRWTLETNPTQKVKFEGYA